MQKRSESGLREIASVCHVAPNTASQDTAQCETIATVQGDNEGTAQAVPWDDWIDFDFSDDDDDLRTALKNHRLTEAQKARLFDDVTVFPDSDGNATFSFRA